MHNIPDLGDFGYVPTSLPTSNNSLTSLLKGIIFILIIGGALFLVHYFLFKEDETQNRLASDIRKALEDSESVPNAIE